MINAQELLDTFRDEVVDLEHPYLWSDEECYRYMNLAYRMFVRLTGGIADFSSEATSVALVTGEEEVDLHPSILRIMSAERVSDQGEVEVINQTDLGLLFGDPDYRELRQLTRANSPGAVRYLLTGRQKHKGTVYQIPVVDDELMLSIYRLPLKEIVDGSHTLDEVESDHHFYLIDWMKHLAYGKQDAETFDKGKSEEFEAKFVGYCEQCKNEWNRYKHKTRIVEYGGL